MIDNKCQCKIVQEMIENDSGEYFKNIEKLNELEKRGVIELYAGDCYLKDIPMHCEKEDRYTISHYYRCRKCGKVFFIGFCCRGGYVFKVKDCDLAQIDFEHIMSQKEQIGTFFNNADR